MMLVAALLLFLQTPADGVEIEKLRQKVAPAVVRIEIDRTADPAASGMGGTHRTLLDYYRRPKGPVTGTVIDGEGDILTSYFNVSGTLNKITVTTNDGKTFEGTLLGFDQNLDIALIKIDAAGLKPLRDGETAKLAQGDFAAVVGVGTAPGETAINTGIVSALGRMKGTALQSDAEMNYGNTGGPLVDADGRLLGLACHINNRAFWGQSSGVGFATKIEKIRDILPRLKKGEKIEKTKQPHLGVMAADAPTGDGAAVLQVMPGSPAAAAGLQPDDVIIELDGKAVAAEDDLRAAIGSKKPGDEVTIKYRRGAETKSATIKLGESP